MKILKFKCKSKEEIPAEFLAFYAEREGTWLLDMDVAVEKEQPESFALPTSL